MAANTLLTNHLDGKGKTYTTGTANVTLPTQTLTAGELEELARVATTQKYEMVLTAGVLTIQKKV